MVWRSRQWVLEIVALILRVKIFIRKPHVDFHFRKTVFFDFSTLVIPVGNKDGQARFKGNTDLRLQGDPGRSQLGTDHRRR